MLLLESVELVEEPVVLGVGDLGVVEDVLAVEMVVELLAELVDALFEGSRGHRDDASDAIRSARANPESPFSKRTRCARSSALR
jgi:hypothetical protein